jgi:hypothetical protein
VQAGARSGSGGIRIPDRMFEGIRRPKPGDTVSYWNAEANPSELKGSQ